MNEITAITPQAKDKRRCNIYIDGRFFCGLTLETTVKNRLKVGQSIDLEKLSEIQLESEKNTALDKALTHLTATQKTEKQIRDFLLKKGYLAGVCDYVVDKLKDYGFIDDSGYAESYISFAAKRKGSRLIKMELQSKGVDKDDIEKAMQSLDTSTQEETAKTIAIKYTRGKEITRELLQKTYRYLLGKGFDYETAKTALRALGEYDDEE